MAEPIRFYMDQHIHGAIAAALRLHGVDVLTAQEAGRCGFSDADQLAFATENHRVMVTHDPDYLAIAADGLRHAGIAWCDASKYGFSIRPLIRMLLLLHAVTDREEMRNRVEYL